MITLEHLLLHSIWVVMTVLGLIFAGLVWLAMAFWDTLRKLWGQSDDKSNSPPSGP